MPVTHSKARGGENLLEVVRIVDHPVRLPGEPNKRRTAPDCSDAVPWQNLAGSYNLD